VQSIIKQAVSWQQAGGIVGTVIAGFLTDSLFGGRRCPVIAILTLAICPISLFAL
jgi:sugar phosphate permease